jgi:hypothetical protein
VVLVSGWSSAWSLGPDDPRYVFATFHNGTQTKLYITSSFDGRRFNPLTGGPVYTSPGTDRLRDPSIVRLPDAWYVCHTAGSRLGNAPYFTILRSTDLVNWTKITDVSMAAVPGTQYTWAPEWVVEEDGSVHILVSVSPLITREHRIYEIHPSVPGQWTTWSDPVELTGTAFPAFTHPPGSTTYVGYYDPYVVKRNGVYHLFYFDVSTGCIHCATAASLTGPYTVLKSGNWLGIGTFKEGGTMLHLGGSRWRFYFANAITSTMYFTESANDWATWTPPALLQSDVVFNHGTVVFNPALPAFKASVETVGASQRRIRFPGVNKNGYQIETSPDLQTWSAYGPVLQGTGGEVAVDHDTGGAERLFYRVQWLPFHVPQ